MQRLLLLLVLFLTGCIGQQLSVFTEYVSIESLPSYQIGTPDPRLYCPDNGERLHIKWSIPYGMHYDRLDLRLSLHFSNGEDIEEWVSLKTPVGIYVYELMNEDYWEREGSLPIKWSSMAME